MKTPPLVLLVDDEEVFLEMTSLKLHNAGYDTVTANGALEAMKRLEELVPDLLLSDIYMPPGPNGLELGLALRKNPKTQNIKIAFLSSLRDPWLELPEDERAEAMFFLRDAVFLDKDVDIESLDEQVLKIMDGE